MDFNFFNLHPSIAAGIQAAGYSEPTPIQEQAIPPVMAGQDVMGLAQTGTGKTAAFALPILHHLLEVLWHAALLLKAPLPETSNRIYGLLGVESPGLTASLALADDVLARVARR